MEGVLAHEMSHVGNRDILLSTIAAILVGTIVLLERLDLALDVVRRRTAAQLMIAGEGWCIF